MKLHKRFVMIVLLLCLAGMIFAQVYAPGDLNTILAEIKQGNMYHLEALMDAWQRGALDGQKEHVVNEIGDYILDNYLKNEYAADYTNPSKLIQSFANASIYASHSASHRAYQNYKEFAFTIGAMAGFRIPGEILHPMEGILDAGNTIAREHDITAGANLQAVTAQFGINASSFLLDGLYLGIRYSYLLFLNVEGFSLTAYTVGLVSHYQLIKGVDAGNDWHHGFKWRGLTVGTGLLFSRTVFTGSLELDDFESHGFKIEDPKLDLDMDITTFIVPLEIYSSALMLWCINVHFGAGVDLAFGKTASKISLKTDRVSFEDSGGYEGDLGRSLEASGGGTMSPSLINPRITAGLGIKLGAVILDIPINYYFHLRGGGLSLGLTLGIFL